MTCMKIKKINCYSYFFNQLFAVLCFLTLDGEIPPSALRPPSLPPVYSRFIKFIMQADFYRVLYFFPLFLFHILSVCLSVCLSPWFAAAYNYHPSIFPTPNPPLVSFFPRVKLFGPPILSILVSE
jgi:hypothetical protein